MRSAGSRGAAIGFRADRSSTVPESARGASSPSAARSVNFWILPKSVFSQWR